MTTNDSNTNRRSAGRHSLGRRVRASVSQGFINHPAVVLDLNEAGTRIEYVGQPPLDRRMTLTCYVNGIPVRYRLYVQWVACYPSHNVIGARFVEDAGVGALIGLAVAG